MFKIFILIILFSSTLFSEYKWEKIDEMTQGGSVLSFTEDEYGNYYISSGHGPYKSTDKGKSWSWLLTSPEYVFNVFCDSFNNIYYFYDSVHVSHDLGKTFNSFKNIERFQENNKARIIFPVAYKDTLVIIVIFEDFENDSIHSSIQYSTDYGKSFVEVFYTANENKVFPKVYRGLTVDARGNFYFFDTYDGFYHIPSIKDRKKYLIYQDEYYYGGYQLTIMHDSILVAVFDNQIRYTIDYGKNWFTKSLPSNFTNIHANGKSIIAVDGFQCWLSNDLGNTWEIIHSNIVSFTSPALPLISTDGICFIRHPEAFLRGELITSDVQEMTESGLYDVSVSPNPAVDYIEVSIPPFESGSGGVVESVRVYDVLGVEHPVSYAATPLSDGNIRLDVSGLVPGVYFVSVGVIVQKFVKI